MATLKVPDHYPPSARAVLKWLDSKASHISWVRRFEVLLEIWLAAIARDEPAYMKLVQELGSRELVNEISHLLGQCSADVAATCEDVLGKVYQEWSSGARNRMAQYFTPTNVSDCMAQMVLADITWRKLNQPGGFSMLEPCSGAGVMPLSAIKFILKEFGPRGLAKVEISAVDLDLVCCRMTALQLRWATMLYPCKRVVVYHGDSLGPPEELKPFASWHGPQPLRSRVVRRTK